MIEMFKKFYANRIFRYIFFGGLTTLVNFVCFTVFRYLFNWELNISNATAIILSILFAYIVNAKHVFNSDATSLKNKITEMFKFFGSRGVTFMIELVSVPLLVYLYVPEYISKILANIIVLVLNYIFSKLIVFTKHNTSEDVDE